MRSFLGVSRNALIAALLGDMGWLPITTITKISCIGFWIRLSNMVDSRLNKQVFIEADNLASNKGYKNWIAHILEILKSYSSDYNPRPTLSCKQSVQYYREYLTKCSKIRWQTEISEVPVGSDSGGRLALYRQIKHNPCTEKYLITMNSLGAGRLWQVSGLGACHWQWRWGGTLALHTVRGYIGCAIVGRWRTPNIIF